MINLEEIKQRLKDATPAPWRVSMSGYSIKAGEQDEKKILAMKPQNSPIEQWLLDADLIANAPNDLHLLISYCEKLEAFKQKVQKVVDNDLIDADLYHPDFPAFKALLDDLNKGE